MKEVKISNVEFTGASLADVDTGLLGWLSATVNGTFRLDGLALRRTADGRLALSFPSRRDTNGKQHPYVRPVDDAARRDIEHQVFAALGIEETTS